VVNELARNGTRITYDNDDNLAAIPKESPNYKRAGGLAGVRAHAQTVALARLAQVFTTTNDRLAEAYRRGGVERVEVIGNFLGPRAYHPPRRHDGIVVGWFAGVEHYADAARLKVVDALQRLTAAHENVRVECIGTDLRLPASYSYSKGFPLLELPAHIAGFDIGIAPLADIPINWTRSDVKLKEYAACGVPWLASPIGPYLGHGEAQGGRLVSDDEWLEALERLVTRERERQQLASNASRWASAQTIEVVTDKWEEVFVGTAKAGDTETPVPTRSFSLKPGVEVRVRPPRSRPRRLSAVAVQRTIMTRTSA
jgi:glycosyltransferase involved in cell wall biosynthesis